MQSASDVTHITSSVEVDHPLELSSKDSQSYIATSEKHLSNEENSTVTPVARLNTVGDGSAGVISLNEQDKSGIASVPFVQKQNEQEGDNASEISDFSDLSQESWQPVQGPIAWVQEQMRRGQSPHKILEDLVPSGTVIPEGLDPIMLWKIIINIVSEPPKRKKLTDINTLDDVLRLLKDCKKIMVLTGAGVSVSCGIPDFRSRDGVYARLTKDFPNLPDPQAMFDIHFFRSDPRPFFKFAKEIYPGQFRPSPCHYFIRLLEEKGKLLRNYTQNIDTLEQVAGIKRIVQCHGSFATASCTVCGHKVDSDAIKEDIFNQVIPHCPKCPSSIPSAVMKPDIVFFGESLPEHFHNQMAADKDECDLLIVIGSSLKVRPVALIPNSLPAHVPQILINRERLHHFNFDVELLGNCDGIIGELCRRLGPGWEQLATLGPPLDEVTLSSLPTPPLSPASVESRTSNSCKSEENVSPTVTGKVTFLHTSSAAEEEMAISTSEGLVSSAQEVSSPAIKPSECSPPGAPEWVEEVGVYEVTTSQSDSACAKTVKCHHHKHAGKWTFSSSRNSITLTDCVSPASGNDHSCSLENGSLSNNSCSTQEIETLVSACHKKDVMYVPNKKCHSHRQTHSYHNHHSHEPQFCPVAHTADDLETGISEDKASLEQQADSRLHEEPDTLTKKRPICPSESAEADSQEEPSPEVKRQRLGSHSEEGIIEESDLNKSDSVNPNESISHDGSLGDIRKMWCSKSRVSLANRMAENQVLYLPPSSYVFKGAEVYTDSESSDSSDDEDEEEDDEDCNEESSASSETEADGPADQFHDSVEEKGCADSTGLKLCAAVSERDEPRDSDLANNMKAEASCPVSSSDDVQQS
ncbi:NAD-dependent protein deacetylase sirtuin-1 [Bulinus truncatus]|nr:NAD-dependent protein deacetylase sirtuin-1 [Bulinus truncatus]